METMDSPAREAWAEAIACLADEGEDVSRFFKNDGKMMPPLPGPHTILASPIMVAHDDANN